MSVVNSLEDYDKNSKAKIVANTAKGRISKWVLQENKARQIFPKTKTFFRLIHTSACAYQDVIKCSIFGKLTCFAFL